MKSMKSSVICLTIGCLQIVLFGQAGGGGLGPPANSRQTASPPRGNQGQLPSRGRGGSSVNDLRPAASPPRGAREIQPNVFMIDDTRPLEVASQLLSQKLGVPISYEEAAWLSEKDIVRASDLPSNVGITSPNQTTRVPKGGTISITVSPASRANIVATAQNAIDTHRRNKNPGEFKIVRFGDEEYSIVADFAEDARGTIVRQNNPLDQRISFPEADRTLTETLELIYRSAGTAAHSTIVRVAPSPSKSLDRVILGARNEVARDVLARALRRPGQVKRMWSLRYDPQYKLYGIWFQTLRTETTTSGRTVLAPVYWPK